MHRAPESAGHAPLYLALIAGAVLLWLSAHLPAAELASYTSHLAGPAPGQPHWAGEITVERSPALFPSDDVALERMVKYAAWSWSERTGKKIIDAGAVTTKGSPTSGRVTFVFASSSEIRALSGSMTAAAATTVSYYTDTGFIAGVTVYVPHILFGECSQHMILHEMGHAIGVINHDGAASGDVMHRDQTTCRHALTAQDVRMAPYGETLCFVEYLPDRSLYFPSAGGFAGFLRYRSGLWHVESAIPTTLRCPQVVHTDPLLQAGDVRGQNGKGSGTISHMGAGVWRLVNAN
jgi:hypothetical protein